MKKQILDNFFKYFLKFLLVFQLVELHILFALCNKIVLIFNLY